MLVYNSFVKANDELVINTVTGDFVQVEPKIHHNIPDAKMPYYEMYCYRYAKERM